MSLLDALLPDRRSVVPAQSETQTQSARVLIQGIHLIAEAVLYLLSILEALARVAKYLSGIFQHGVVNYIISTKERCSTMKKYHLKA